MMIKNIFKSIGLILLVCLFPTFFFLCFNIDPNSITDRQYAIYITIADAILLGIYILIFKDTLKKDLKDFVSKFNYYISESLKYWGISLGIMFVSNLVIVFILNKTITNNEQLVRSCISAAPLLMIFSVGICAPITEELTFRKSIKNAINNKWIYVLISGLLFGSLHIISSFNNIIDLVYLIPYCAPGIAFALLYYKTDNIFCSISVHAIHNVMALVLLLIGAALI